MAIVSPDLFRLLISWAEPESKEARVLFPSAGALVSWCLARRFPVLLFLGM